MQSRSCAPFTLANHPQRRTLVRSLLRCSLVSDVTSASDTNCAFTFQEQFFSHQSILKSAYSSVVRFRNNFPS
jgi:hypothetical protein